MYYKIINTIFKFDGQDLYINNKSYKGKRATIEALLLFLQNNGNIVSKDELLKHIWKDVIVSEASVFKLVQLVRNIFIKAGLPKDIIENVYGKGYRITYNIERLPKDFSIPAVASSNRAGLSFKSYYFTITTIILLGVGLLIYTDTSQKVDFLNLDKKESMVALMNSDWEAGLLQIDTILQQDSSHLSSGDLAFLYGKKGLSQYHLQRYNKSIKSYRQALKLFKSLNDKVHLGQTHLNLARSYGRLTSADNSHEKQQEHISSAIILFEQTNSQEKIIDAQMALAYFYKKNNKIPDAISLYEKTILDAQNIGDTTGEMIANSNLAAAYVVINDYDKAIELGQKGLQVALEIGKGIYIANTYSFLSDLYQNQYKSIEAMAMIQQAIKYQLSTNALTHLSPKLITLNFILVQTYQFDKAEELLKLSSQYTMSMNANSGVSIISLYQGLNAARQNNWLEAEQHLLEALAISQRINFKYKQPLNQAYLALAHYFNNNYLQAIEPAMAVINNKSSNQQSQAIAALALAYTYGLMEKIELAEKWYLQTQKLQDPKWLFEYQLFLKLKLERQQQSNSILISQTEREIIDISLQMQNLAQSVLVDADIFTNLKQQILQKIVSNN
ncbi:hypothetical protein MNBD_GAMMA03-511 [hydrothermal vent metagenome]|uniref:OmpR/PhoB-type domain-containing protein n=1 Tax=hydrothermal vent metagenome TaxID=652676 RepID=A0A3B0VZI7_9ZZZZ